MITRAQALIESVRAHFAPDPRTAIFDVEVYVRGRSLVFSGATSVPAAVEALHAQIAALPAGIRVHDEIERLPAAEISAPHALVTAAIAPMLAAPNITATQLSQGLFSERLTVLREHGAWFHCRAGDGYLGWMHRGYLVRASEVRARGWEVGGGGVRHFSRGAELIGSAGEELMRIPWGAPVHLRGNLVLLPQGGQSRFRGSLAPAQQLARLSPPQGASLVETAREWLGTPYLWGGRTPWGADCSGFVQAIFAAHGVALPRDSDLQAQCGRPIEPTAPLRPGDLLFFAEVEGRITHVAISLGGTGIIHSAIGNGGVRIDDLAGGNPLEQELRRLLVRARRVVSPGS